MKLVIWVGLFLAGYYLYRLASFFWKRADVVDKIEDILELEEQYDTVVDFTKKPLNLSKKRKVVHNFINEGEKE